MSVSISFHDQGLRELRKRLKAISRLHLTLGFQGPSGRQRYPTGVNVATVAAFQEFGTFRIPQRSFLRATMFEQRDKVEAIMARAVRLTTFGLGPVAALSDAGGQIAALIKRKIETSRAWAKRNQPSTVARKGFDYPLHETDLMAESVTWAVRKGRSIVAMGGPQ